MSPISRTHLEDAWIRAGDLRDALDLRDPLIAKLHPELAAGLTEIRRLIGLAFEVVPVPPSVVRLSQYRRVCAPRLAPQPPTNGAA